MYFEGLKREPNAGFGPKDIYGIASTRFVVPRTPWAMLSPIPPIQLMVLPKKTPESHSLARILID